MLQGSGLDCRPRIPSGHTVCDRNRNQVRADTVTLFKSVSCSIDSFEEALAQLREAEGKRDEAVAYMDEQFTELGYAR